MKRFLSKRLRLILRSLARHGKTLSHTCTFQAVLTFSSLPYLTWQLLMPVIPLGKMADALSRVSRNMLEKQKTRHVVGFNLASVLLVFSLIPFTQIQADSYPSSQEVLIPTPEMTISTEETFQMPVPGYVSQQYGWFHHGIDIAGNNGVAVYPITNGIVKEISYAGLGYGLNVIIDHGNGIISRYAHLQAEAVELNQRVTKKDVLGYVGSTGWSTGPHLHLEVYQNNRSVNPFAYVPPKYSEEIKVIASNNTTIASQNADSLMRVASVSAAVEFKEVAPGFTEPNWFSEATPSALPQTQP